MNVSDHVAQGKMPQPLVVSRALRIGLWLIALALFASLQFNARSSFAGENWVIKGKIECLNCIPGRTEVVNGYFAPQGGEPPWTKKSTCMKKKAAIERDLLADKKLKLRLKLRCSQV